MQNKDHFNQALLFFEKRAQLGEELYAANPHNYNLKNGLGISYYKLAGIFIELGNPEEALPLFQKVEKIVKSY